MDQLPPQTPLLPSDFVVFSTAIDTVVPPNVVPPAFIFMSVAMVIFPPFHPPPSVAVENDTNTTPSIKFGIIPKINPLLSK